MSFILDAKHNYVICKLDASAVKQNQPIEVVDSSQKQSRMEVVAIGEDVTCCKPGDKIMPYGNQFIGFPHGSDHFIVMTDDQVVGVFND